MKIKLTSMKGKTEGMVLFDDDDIMLLFNYRWHLGRINSRTTYVCARKQNSGKFIRMHNLILPPKPGLVVDHIDGNGLDNRRSNLRYCTHADNLRKRPPANGKKYKGVYFCKRPKTTLSKPWSAKLNTKNGSIHIGYFATEKDAAIAYNRAALKYFKDPYCLNKIEKGV